MPLKHASKNSLKQTQRAASHLPSQKCSAEAPGQGRACCQRNLFLFFPSSHSLDPLFLFPPPTPLSCVSSFRAAMLRPAYWQHFEKSAFYYFGCVTEMVESRVERGARERKRDWSGESTTFIIQLKLSGGQKEDGWHLVVRAEMYIKTVKLQTFFISVGVLVLFDYILLFFTSFGNSCSWS